MKTSIALFTLSSTLLFTACSSTVTPTEAECQATSWNRLGLADGVTGANKTRLKQRQLDCAEYNISPDLTSYNSGYEEGLSNYCVYSKGVALGQSGQDFNDVCAQFEYVLFGTGWIIGNSKYKLEQELKTLSKSLTSTESKLRSIGSQTKELASSAATESKQTKAELEIQRAKLARRYAELQEQYDTLVQKIEANIRKLSEQ